ncbi:hypothetical protein [Tissierella praeacuta]|uniref:hypothetical protein n=1 Tax=Tissierella praeacuta TaxID=43131 RepID=UPI0028976DD8|nr:hypothetical protein [Tissierella praeacuta]
MHVEFIYVIVFLFSSYKLAIICSPKHKLTLEEHIDINKLIQEKLLLREKGSAIRDVFDSALPKILIEEEINSGEIFEIKVNDFQLVNINHIVFHKDKFQTKSFKTLIKIIKNKADDK